jgi:hypothetical protein
MQTLKGQKFQAVKCGGMTSRAAIGCLVAAPRTESCLIEHTLSNQSRSKKAMNWDCQ